MSSTTRALTGLILVAVLTLPAFAEAQERRVRPGQRSPAELRPDRPGQFSLRVRMEGPSEEVRLVYAGQLPETGPAARMEGEEESGLELRGDPVPGIQIALDINIRPPSVPGGDDPGVQPTGKGPDGALIFERLIPGLYLFTWNPGDGCRIQPVVITEDGVALPLRGIG